MDDPRTWVLFCCVQRMVSLTGSEGCAVTTYGDQAIGPLKKRLKEAINSLAESLDEETRRVI